MVRRDHKGKGDGRKGGGGGGRPPVSREVEVSKALSYLLRHGAKDAGVQTDDGGWANVADVLRWRRLSSLSVTLEELKKLVNTNDKQRFVLKDNPDYNNPLSTSSATHRTATLPTSDPNAYLIRASQGHSLEGLSSEKLLDLLNPEHSHFPTSGYVVHGTYQSAWEQILKSGGLKPMGRRMIHFATDLPPPLPPLDLHASRKSTLQSANAGNSTTQLEDNDQGGDRVISGMRSGATVLIWADVRGSMERGDVKWWRSKNGVVLTEGTDGLLGFEWIKWVERRGTGEILWGEKPQTYVGNNRSALKSSTSPNVTSKPHTLDKTAGSQSRGARAQNAEVGEGEVGGSSSDDKQAFKVQPSAIKESWDD